MRLLLVLLAVLLAIGNAQHVNFRRMSSTGTDAGVKADTGYAAPVIGYLWRKYRAGLPAARGGGATACPQADEAVRRAERIERRGAEAATTR